MVAGTQGKPRKAYAALPLDHTGPTPRDSNRLRDSVPRERGFIMLDAFLFCLANHRSQAASLLTSRHLRITARCTMTAADCLPVQGLGYRHGSAVSLSLLSPVGELVAETANKNRGAIGRIYAGEHSSPWHWLALSERVWSPAALPSRFTCRRPNWGHRRPLVPLWGH